MNRRAKDFAHDNCCLANTTALQLQSKLSIDDIIYTSYENEVCFSETYLYSVYYAMDAL